MKEEGDNDQTGNRQALIKIRAGNLLELVCRLEHAHRGLIYEIGKQEQPVELEERNDRGIFCEGPRAPGRESQ